MDPYKLLNEKITKEAKEEGKLKDDYEKYFYSLFQGKLGCKKIPLRKNHSTPDFEIVIDKNKKFITEVKGLDPIYQDIHSLVCEICKTERNICRDYKIGCSSYQIHRDDKVTDEIKSVINEKLRNPDNQLPSTSIIKGHLIKKGCPNNEYNLTVERRERKGIRLDGPYRCAKVTSNLRSVLYCEDHREQYEQIDFLTLINLNQEIVKDDLILNTFGGSVEEGDSSNAPRNAFGVIDTSKFVHTTPDEFFSQYEKMKLILFLDPLKNGAYIIPRFCENEECANEQSSLIFALSYYILKPNNFKIEVLCFKPEWLEYTPLIRIVN